MHTPLSAPQTTYSTSASARPQSRGLLRIATLAGALMLMLGPLLASQPHLTVANARTKLPKGAWVIRLGSAQFVVRFGAQSQAQPAATTQTSDDVQSADRPQDERGGWAYDLAGKMGNAQPSAAMLARLVEWSIAEDSGLGAMNRNNPWNTTICGYNMVGSINADGACGVGHYATYQDGLDATVATLAQSNFSAITNAIRANDPDKMLTALIASGWAESRYNGGAGWPHVDPAQYKSQQPAQDTPPARASYSLSYVLQGDVGVNVRAALDANGGSIRHFTIQPGETWSFGHSIAPISAIGYLPVVCGPAGCNAGGGWCDLSKMYVVVAQQLGLRTNFPAHGGINDPQMPGILLDNDGNGGDLQIVNTTGQPVTFTATEQDGELIVSAG